MIFPVDLILFSSSCARYSWNWKTTGKLLKEVRKRRYTLHDLINNRKRHIMKNNVERFQGNESISLAALKGLKCSFSSKLIKKLPFESQEKKHSSHKITLKVKVLKESSFNSVMIEHVLLSSHHTHTYIKENFIIKKVSLCVYNSALWRVKICLLFVDTLMT